MNKIKISHEVPLCLLEESLKFNDYNYCLPHLLDQYEEYKNFFIKSKELGRYIIMDNSLHELGVAYDTKRLLYWINELKPNEFIVPDVWEDKTQSVVNAKSWIGVELPKEVTKVAVVQAQNLYEAIICYQTYKDLGYKKIAFSYGASYYNDLCPHPNKDLGKAIGRVKVISKLFNLNVINKTDRVHLLGCAVPQEFGWYKGMNFIESIDTSNPVMAALDSVFYTASGLYTKPEANMNDFFNIDRTKINENLLNHNILNFKKINGL
jgi:hypothetical protein